ncbi:MAG TPA: PSD1 and planctomycete cytochrome C domain-containing protein, partial [Verrucomicrobiae bacterium]
VPKQNAEDDAEFFERKIRPVLADSCFECHSHQSKKLKGGLYLDNREDLLKGGETGVAVVLGDPEKSRLIEAVRWHDPDFQMPPKKQLSEHAIADLALWIKKGAPWPKSEAPKPLVSEKEIAAAEKRKREHWAWQPVSNPRLPVVKTKSWPQSGIDYFILAALEKKGMTPAPRADRRTLIRRAYFDLIGLPPSPEEIHAFEADPSPAAYEKLIDNLLANPHYGERWGRHWLDVARYGEDQAHSFQPRLYPQGFRYRDWLANALNRDMPYNQFIMEQLAADLLEGGNKYERTPALGFFALGPVYYGDGKMFDQFDDRIDTLTRGFLGLTVACARCHDHKYDPISSKDYYALAGVIASSEYIEAPLAPPEVVQSYEKAQSEITAKTNEVAAMLEQARSKLSEDLLSQSAKYMLAVWKWQNAKQNETNCSVRTIAKREQLHSFVLERWVKYLEGPKRLELAKWREATSGKITKADAEPDSVRQKQIARAADSFQAYLLSVNNLKNAFQQSQTAAAALSLDKTNTLEKSKSDFLDLFLGKDGICALTKAETEAMLDEGSRAKLAALRQELDTLKKKAPAKYAFAHALKDAPKPHKLPLLIRGNPENAGEEVPRHFLSILSGGNPPAFTNGSGRLELARAIADPKNPLTSRVFVNRIWQHHFGQGLVRTTSNFGLLGEPPTNPALLDYLAHQLIENGWSMKSLHRQIMLSAAYQMSSKFEKRNYDLDPENKLVWRMNRRRLEVEAWRDSMLAVAGNLDDRVGGPSVELASLDNHRRTYYARVSRHDLDSLLRLFDFPDPNVTSDSRTTTTVPLQQLFVLNSEFMVRQAKALAARLAKAATDSDERRIQRAFQLVYGRPATKQEMEIGVQFLATQKSALSGGEKKTLDAWQEYAQVLLSANEFLYVD